MIDQTTQGGMVWTFPTPYKDMKEVADVVIMSVSLRTTTPNVHLFFMDKSLQGIKLWWFVSHLFVYLKIHLLGVHSQ